MNIHTKIHPTLLKLVSTCTVARIEIYALPCNCTIKVITI